MELIVGRKYNLDGNICELQDVGPDAAEVYEYAFFVEEGGDLGFELIQEDDVWRHMDSGDVAKIEEVK